MKILVEFADGSIVGWEKQEDGSWKAEGFQQMSYTDMLRNIEMWVNASYGA